jgi:hypothetical protein
VTTVEEPQAARPGARSRSRATTWALAVAALLVLAAAQVLRQRGLRSWNTVWAEDGAVFFQGGNHFSSMVHTYSGYLELVPRLLGALVNVVPLDQVARAITATSAVVTAMAALAIYSLNGALVESRALRAVLALSVPLLPSVLYENLNSITNVIWPLLFVNFWALLVVPSTRRRAWAWGAVCAMSALSSVLALLYLPLAALFAWKRRDAPSRIVLGAFGAGLLVQMAFVVTASDSSPHAATHPADLLPLYSVRVLGSGLLGEQGLARAWNHFGYGVGALGTVVVGAIVAVLIMRTSGTRRCLGALTIAYSVVMYVVPVNLRGSTSVELLDHNYVATGARFAALSLWLLLSGIAILLSGTRLPVVVRQVCVVVFVAQFAVLAVVDFRADNGRSLGPAWSDAVAAAEAACARKPATAVVEVPIAPPGWEVRLACERVG